MLLSPFAGLLYYPSSFILPLDPMKGQRWSPISIFNDLKRKISHQFFFSLFMAILNFSNPKLWLSIYLFKKCSEGRCRWVCVSAPPPTTWREGWISKHCPLGLCPAHCRRNFCSLPISFSTSLSAPFLEKADTFIHQSSLGMFPGVKSLLQMVWGGWGMGGANFTSCSFSWWGAVSALKEGGPRRKGARIRMLLKMSVCNGLWKFL